MDGLLLVNKPKSMTSHDVVAVARRAFNTKNIGHAGTLDPLATGLLVLLVGEATKVSDYVLNDNKTYEIEVLLGFTSDTLDVTGELEKQQVEALPSSRQIAEVVDQLKGKLQLQVPHFSAVKVKGKKLVDQARKGVEFTPPTREMDFKEVELLGVEESRVRVRITCEKGGYMRSWAAELGKRLSCGGVISAIHRQESGGFDCERACDFEEIKSGHLELGEAWVPLAEALPRWKGFTLVGRDEGLMANGQIPNFLVKRLISEQKRANNTRESRSVKVLRGSTGDLLSILELQPFQRPKIRRIFAAQKGLD